MRVSEVPPAPRRSLKEPDYYEIIGYPRDGGNPRCIYRGHDWSNVSDMMCNGGEPDATYARMQLYENGRLIEDNICGEPGERRKEDNPKEARERNDVVIVVVPEQPSEQVPVIVEKPVAPVVLEPTINVTVKTENPSETNRERKSDGGQPGLQPQPPARDAWPEKERSAGDGSQPEKREPAAPPVEKEYAYIPPEERRENKKDPENNSEKKPEPEQKVAGQPNKKNSPNNSDSQQKEFGGEIVSELFEPDTPAPQADADGPYKKQGKVGRKRRYEEQKDDIPPVKDVVLYYHTTGRHYPGMSEEMQTYYDYWYFTKPSKGKDGKDYERHVKAYARSCKWIAEEDGEAVPSVGNRRITDLSARRRAGKR